jgi:hypothetical protein
MSTSKETIYIDHPCGKPVAYEVSYWCQRAWFVTYNPGTPAQCCETLWIPTETPKHPKYYPELITVYRNVIKTVNLINDV